MLDNLRNVSKSWVSKFLLGLLVLSFALWGVAGALDEGLSGNSVIVAGGSEVSPTEYRLAYERQLMALSQQFNQRLSRDQAQALGINNQVMSQLVAGVLLDEEARQMNLGLSKDRLARLTGDDAAFHDASGNFNPNQFNAVLRQAGMSPQSYLDNLGKVARRQQIVEAVSDGVNAPDTLLKALALYQGESRTIDFITLIREENAQIAAPEQADLQKWYDDHLSQYRAPEYRKVSYVTLEAEDIADPSAVTADEVQDYYKQNIARYTTPEKRTLEQLSFTTQEDAEKALEKLKAGSTFAELVTESGKSPEDVRIGTLEKDDIPDQVVADAAFSLSANGTSDVVNGAFGPVILHVSDISEQNVQPLTEVEQDIRKTIAVSLALSSINNIHDSYEEDRGHGASMKEAADKLHLKTQTIDAIDAQGLGLDGKDITSLPDHDQFLTAIFEADQGLDNDALPTNTRGYIWYQVDEVTPSRDRTLDEVKDLVTNEWKQDQAEKALVQKADDLRKRLDGGETLDEIAAQLNLEKQTKRGVTRSATDAELSPAAIAKIFGGADQITGIAPAINEGSQILFKVTEVTEPAGISAESLPQNARQAISNRLADDLLEQLVNRMQSEYPVSVNQKVIDQALAY